MRSRIAFETDVVNDYFSRGQYSGKAYLRFCGASLLNSPIPDYRLNLNNGAATLSLPFPGSANVGDSFEYELVVQDETMVDPFVNRFVVTVGPNQDSSGGNGGGHQRSDGKNQGNNDTPEGLAIPSPIPIHESEWENHGFDKNTALKAVYDPFDGETIGWKSHLLYQYGQRLLED